jgi:hypothetical protein
MDESDSNSLESNFEKLLNFAKTNNFSASCEEVYIVEDKSIKRFSDLNDICEIPKSALNKFEDYRKYFDEVLLKSGHSWVNLHFLGLIENHLILTIEFPRYKNDATFTTVNISLPENRIVENNWNASLFYQIIGE